MNQQLLEEYRDQVLFRDITQEEFLQELKKQLTLEEISFEDEPAPGEPQLKFLKEYRPDDSFQVFRLVDDRSNQKYYKSFVKEDSGQEGIYLILGNKDYMETNSNELFEDLFLQRGIPEGDYCLGNARTMQYIDILQNR